jgi:hypothetical protein
LRLYPAQSPQWFSAIDLIGFIAVRDRAHRIASLLLNANAMIVVMIVALIAS